MKIPCSVCKRLFVTNVRITKMMFLCNQMLVVGDESGKVLVFDAESSECVATRRIVDSVRNRLVVKCRL